MDPGAKPVDNGTIEDRAADEALVDETIRSKAASEGLRLRLYKSSRDDIHAEYIGRYTQGFVSGESDSPATCTESRWGVVRIGTVDNIPA